MSALAPLAFVAPIVAACLVAGAAPLSRRGPAVAGGVGGVLAAAALSAVVFARAGDEPTVVWLGGWRPRGGIAFGIDLAVDRVGAGLALFAACLAIAAFVLAARLILVSPHLFHAVTLLLVAATIAYCLTGDLFDLFVFFELLSVAAYVLVGYEVRRREALEGALTFAVTNTVGSIMLLFGIALVYAKSGALNLAQIGAALAPLGADRTVVVAFGLIAVGLLVKAAAVPFHFWVADAYAVAPTPICILLSGVVAELGLYGLARVWWTAFAPALGGGEEAVRAILVCLGVVTGLAGGALALAQHHLKRMLACVTIGQVGVMLAGVGLLSADGLAGAALFVVGDGLVKAALFVCLAVVQHRCDRLDVRALHGAGRALPGLAALYGVGALAVAGMPPFGPFVGRAVIEDAALAIPGWGWLPAALTVVSALSGAALLRAGARVFGGWGRPAPRDAFSAAADDDEEETADEAADAPRATSPWLWGPAAVLIAAALAWGVVPGLVGATADAAARFADPGAYARAVLGAPGGGAAAAGGGGAAAPGGGGAAAPGGGAAAPGGGAAAGGGAAFAPPPPPEAHWPGHTSFLYAAASVAAALALAWAGLRLRMEALPRRLLRLGQGLRALHSGHAGDYVAWTAAGATVLLALLAATLT